MDKKNYEIEVSFRFTDGAERIIGEVDTIEEAKELCQNHVINVFKNNDEKLQDLGPVKEYKERNRIVHVFAIPGVRFFVKNKIQEENK